MLKNSGSTREVLQYSSVSAAAQEEDSRYEGLYIPGVSVAIHLPHIVDSHRSQFWGPRAVANRRKSHLKASQSNRRKPAKIVFPPFGYFLSLFVQGLVGLELYIIPVPSMTFVDFNTIFVHFFQLNRVWKPQTPHCRISLNDCVYIELFVLYLVYV